MSLLSKTQSDWSHEECRKSSSDHWTSILPCIEKVSKAMQKPTCISLDNCVITCPWDKFVPSPLNLNLLIVFGMKANYLLNFVYLFPLAEIWSIKINIFLCFDFADSSWVGFLFRLHTVRDQLCQFKVFCLSGYIRQPLVLLFREKQMGLELDQKLFHPDSNLFFKLQQKYFLTIWIKEKKIIKIKIRDS